MSLPDFREVWCIDFEFGGGPGNPPEPICLVASELRSGLLLRFWQDELRSMHRPPYPVGDDSLVVAYYASAEAGCHLALGWPAPENVLDLFAEFRVRTNGLNPRCGAGLLGALAYFGLDSAAGDEKQEMRRLAMSGGPWTDDERRALLDYCESDVRALARLLERMAPELDLPRALLRGRWMVTAASIERNGVPIDVDALERMRARWDDLKLRLVAEIDRDYGVFEGPNFRFDRFEALLAGRSIPWPRTPTRRLALDDDTFRDMCRAFPDLSPLRELRVSLGQLRLSDLAVGADGRNRCLLSSFRAKTGRNQPSNSRFVFGPAVFMRGLIRPSAGFGVAYVDWSQQEFGIAAGMSGDPAMIAAYCDGDPYLTFAKQAKAVPAEATKESHREMRERFKQCALGVQYGMGGEALARRIGCSTIEARNLIELHRRVYRRFWHWSDAVVDRAMLALPLHSVFGWPIRVDGRATSASLRNFPMQANGAEMLRIAGILATERGVRIAAPVHDAFLIEAPLADLDAAVSVMQRAMADASRIVLADVLELRTDVKIVRAPDRYMDPRGRRMWDTVARLAGIS